MIWLSPDIIFQYEFSHNSDYIIWRLYFKIYDMSSPGIIFQCEFSRDCHYVIWRLYFEYIWYDHQQTSFSFYKIQNKKVLQINVKIKIQDKKAHLRQCQG